MSVGVGATALECLTTPGWHEASERRPPGTVTTEHLALIGFTARLSVEATNADAEEASTREEARLLMSLLRPSLSHGGGDEEDEEDERKLPASSGSSRALLCDEDMDGDAGEGSGTAPADGGERGFSFACPSLSIADAPCREDGGGDADADGGRPSALLRRPLRASERDDVKPAAESMATNLMRSFGGAVLWRGRTWIGSLARVMSLKERVAAEKSCNKRLREEFADESAGDGTGDGTCQGQEQGNTLDNDTADADDSSQDSASGSEAEAEHEDEEDEPEAHKDDTEEDSNELKVIYAVARSISQVKIRSVKTSFRVMPQRTGPRHCPSQEQEQDANDSEAFVLASPSHLMSSMSMGPPPPKRRVPRKISASPSLDPTQCTQVSLNLNQNRGQYQVEHGLAFEAILKVSILQANGIESEQDVTLKAPGTVSGTFFNAYDGKEGTEILKGVTVALDTDVLALFMEQQSRLIVRKAAEADMLASIASAKSPSPPQEHEGQTPCAEPSTITGAGAGVTAEPGEDYSHNGYTPPFYATDTPSYSLEAKPAKTAETEHALYYVQYDSTHTHPQHTVVTPKHHITSPPPGFSFSLRGQEITEDLTMPPPVCGLQDRDHPGTPSNICSPTEFLKDTSSHSSASPYLFSPGPAGTLQSSAMPCLVSPSPTNSKVCVLQGGDESELPYAPPAEEDGQGGWYGHYSGAGFEPSGRGGAQTGKGGPSLPILVEVACAAMSEE